MIVVEITGLGRCPQCKSDSFWLSFRPIVDTLVSHFARFSLYTKDVKAEMMFPPLEEDEHVNTVLSPTVHSSRGKMQVRTNGNTMSHLVSSLPFHHHFPSSVFRKAGLSIWGSLHTYIN